GRQGVERSFTPRLIIEEEDQIEPATLHATERVALLRARHVRHRPLQAQEARELILEDEFRRLLRAEPLTQPDEQPLGDLLPDGDARAKPALPRRLDLELVEVQRAADRLR